MTESPIRQAINLTLDTITQRAASYRNLVVLTALGTITIMVTTVVLWDVRILAALCWLLPLISGWFWLDARRLQRWSARTIAICMQGRLDLEVFRSTLAHMRHLPQQTIAGMFEYLPQSTSSATDASQGLVPVQHDLLAEERSYGTTLCVSVVGCLFVMAGLIVNPWLCPIGLAICFFGAKLARSIAGLFPAILRFSLR